MAMMTMMMKMKKAIPSKALVIKINLVILAFLFVIYGTLLLWPSSSVYHENAAALVRCSLRGCHHKVDKGIKMKAVLEQTETNHPKPKRNLVKTEKPSFLNDHIGNGTKIGMVNMDEEDISEWNTNGETIPIDFEQVSEIFEWKDLFPEWIDEEEEIDGPLCPEIPMPDLENYGYVDMVVAKLPCKYPEEGWGRDVFRLQVHLIAAKLAAKRGKRGWNEGRTKVVLLSKCRPMLELFRCNDMVTQEGDWWFFQPQIERLEHKISLPVGSCNLALPLWGKGMLPNYILSLPPNKQT
ncbi:hypothetical protein CsSME_00035872 [Camellia sinensis var. sinensis]